MFRTSSRPSSEATTAVAASGLPLELGDSSAVGRGRAGRPARPRPTALLVAASGWLIQLKIIIIIKFITFMKGIYNYITETNHVAMVYRVAATLCLQIMVLVTTFPKLNVWYFYINIFRSIC
jgi:hypothetical protein